MQASGGGGGGGGGASQSQYGGGDMNPPPIAALDATAHLFGGGADQSHQQVVEAASPISSRPPAGNLDEFLSGGDGGSGFQADDDALAGGTGGGGNRWPRQETLALLRIRSEMDAIFRDATLKGPLWEDVSSKLAQLGYKRSAKKCKEKFENVHKYYKRTKEGRAGRQDGKTYRFFTELEALHAAAATASVPVSASPSPAPANVFLSSPTSVAPPINPTPISSIRFGGPQAQQHPFPGMFGSGGGGSGGPPPAGGNPDQGGGGGAGSFSTNSASSSPMTEDEEEYNLSSRKRKRGSETGRTKRMMEFFEGLMKQVMRKQEAMQQSFLEAVEKREQDRMIREEAWKRQEMARLSREHELMAQERAVSASRDAAIVSFLQKITGQTVQLPTHVNVNPPVPPPQPPPQAPVHTPPPPQPQSQPQQRHRPQPTPPPPPPQQQQHQVHHQTPPPTTDVVMAVPEQQVPPPQETSGGGGSGSSEPASSRWPKTEVLALINLRSGLEPRYQEAGPKGPLWEEISLGMQRMGYRRSSKRCKEKWENINKYFKKVKESNKKRPEDAKTCPYFHQLDALYRKKILTTASGSTSGSFTNQNAPEHQQEAFKLDQTPPTTTVPAPAEPENKNGSHAAISANIFGESTAKKPEDIVKEMMQQQQQQQQQQQRQRQQLMVDDYDKIDEGDSDNIEDDEEDEDDDDEELEQGRKMDYKIEFQRQNTTTGPNSNAGGNGAPSFLAMVQ